MDVAESLAMLLKPKGNVTRTANDCLQALNLAAAFEPDAILLDIGMPQLSDYEVCRRIRQQTWSKNTVMIDLTDRGQDEDKRRTPEAGFNFHLIEPVLPEALEKLLACVTVAKGTVKTYV